MVDRCLARTSVIVAGAGLSGLAAAHELHRHGASVSVVEARDRIGGRVWTMRAGFEQKQHAEAGGDLIDEGQSTMRRLVNELGLRLSPILPGGFRFVRRSPGGVTAPASEPWQALGEALQPLIATWRLAERRFDSPIASAIASQSVADWLDSTRAGEDLRALARGLRGFFLADPDTLSMLPVLQEFDDEGTPGREQMYRVEGGNDLVAERLAAPLADHVHLQSPLVAVTQDGNRVRVKVAATKGGPTELTADFLVVTVPATLIASIEWSPRMGEAQFEAFARLKYGFATKTLLQFDRRFWQAPGKPRAYGTDLAIGAVWDGNEEQAGDAGIVALLAGGSASNATEALVARGGADAVVHELSWFGAATARLLAFRSVRWEDDPWARGGYAYFDPAYAPAWRDWLAKPFGRVLFAGEHTSFGSQGYMNGAVESGLRAAAEVAALADGAQR